MRLIYLGLCLLVTAGSSNSLTSPASPTTTGSRLAHTEAHDGTELPFGGSFTTATEVPPPSAYATAEGMATHLGRFSATIAAAVNPDGTSTGTFTFTAANGDQLSGTFVGEGVFLPPNTARITEVATIQDGTGRLAGATGTFTMVRFDTIDFPTGKATGYGTFEGQINLNK